MDKLYFYNQLQIYIFSLSDTKKRGTFKIKHHVFLLVRFAERLLSGYIRMDGILPL